MADIAKLDIANRVALGHNPAMRGILNIIIGAVMIVGGLSGSLVMRGTESGVALAVLGGVFVVLGLFRLRSSA
jgi:membrane-bound ClpP family serine protease